MKIGRTMKTPLRVLLTLLCLPLIACIQFNELHGQRGEIIVRTVDWKPKSTRLPVGFTTEFDFVTRDKTRPDGVTLASADPLRLEIISSEWDHATMRAIQSGPCDLLFMKNGKELDRVTFDAADVTELPLSSKNRALRVVAGIAAPA